MLIVKLLGPLEIETDLGSITLTGAKQRRLLIALAIRRGSVGRETLQEDLGLTWGSLRTGITRLRGLLGPDSIMAENHGYQLAADTVDLFEFENRLKAIVSGEAIDDHDRIRGLQAALDMWRGEALVEVAADEWARPIAVHLEELRAAAEEDLAEALIAVGHRAQAISVLGRNIEGNPYRDRPRALLMVALAAEGRRTEALRAFQSYRSLLAEEIGTVPSAELVALDQRIAAGDVPSIGRVFTAGDDSPATAPTSTVRAQPHPAEAHTPPQAGAAAVRDPSTRRDGADHVDSSDAVLPHGFLTFLFTDIAGSSIMWAEDPEEMADALEDHDEVISSAIESNGGHIVKHTGDGFLAVFQQPDSAAAAALAAQPWLTLPVRMGIHCGTAVVRRGDYFGMCVTRCARLMGVAHGGQVLVSQDLAPLLIDRNLTDLGLHQLKGVASAETIFQLNHPDLPAEFDPLESAEATRHNLPTPVSSLVGRSDEIAEVADAIIANRMVSLVGMGGAGKTRAAIEAARHRVDDFQAGVHFVELASVADPDLVTDAIQRGMMGRSVERSNGSVLDSLVDHFRRGHALLVLDNCEHLGDAPGRVAERLLEGAPQLHILATSRDGLGVEGEHLHRVRALGLDDAVQLFIERAVAVRPTVAVDDDARHDIAAICRRVDQLPLAVELMAAQTIAMDPADIRKRMDTSLEMAGVRRSTIERHRTLRTAIGWSYDSLDETEKLVLQQVSVFAAPFSLDAAEVVCVDTGASVNVAGVLVSLVSKSLVEVDAESRRYRLLQTVRDFAADALAATERYHEAHDRHAAFYRDTVAHFGNEVYRGGIQVDSSDLANLRAAAQHHIAQRDGLALLELIIAGQEYWSHVGAVDDIEAWLTAASTTGDVIPVDVQVQAMTAVASALTIARPLDGSAIAYGTQAVELAARSDAGERSRFLAACELGYAYVHADASDPRGPEWLERSIIHAGDHPLQLMRANSRLSVAAFIGNNKPAGLEPAERAVALAESMGVDVFAKVALAFRAATRAVLGDNDGALEDLGHLENLPRTLDPVWKGTVHVTAANAWLALGDEEHAKRHLLDALTVTQADVGEVIATMIGSTACTLTDLPSDLVAFTAAAVERFHSATQPMLAEQLRDAKQHAELELGSAGFRAAYGAGRQATLDEAHQRVVRWLTGLDR